VGFEELLAEGDSVPVEGWDFSWFDGRASEQRPSWGYAMMLADRMGRASSVLDVETGGGEVFAWALDRAPQHPGLVAATESWAPNAILAQDRLASHSALLVRSNDHGALPFRPGAFNLVASRHPVVTNWSEVARVLRPGGLFFSQQVGPGSNRELYEFLMGPQSTNAGREPAVARRHAQQSGLEVLDVRQESLETVFFDVAAVVYFLRKVPWTVPGFTTDRYRDRLADLHRHIEHHGCFLSHAQRFLIEAKKAT
jgi:SAM-dependent methyltransferase